VDDPTEDDKPFCPDTIIDDQNDDDDDDDDGHDFNNNPKEDNNDDRRDSEENTAQEEDAPVYICPIHDGTESNHQWIRSFGNPKNPQYHPNFIPRSLSKQGRAARRSQVLLSSRL
jgi:hypothetical protein